MPLDSTGDTPRGKITGMSRSEFDFIESIRRRTGSSPLVPLGIGDDAAVLANGSAGESLVAVDMLMDGTHFRLDETGPELVGRKSLAVNLSDIAAMGGRPVAAFLAIALPASLGRSLAERLTQGVLDLARDYGVVLAGGDTNVWNGPLVTCVTVVGQPIGRSIQRSGAKPGDWLMVTGSLGGSLAGRHLRFEPRVREASLLMDLVDIHAMIDISDGLAADVHHLARESGVGVTIDGDAIPISADVPGDLPHEERLQHALSDGEDFELLFAVTPDEGSRLLREWKSETSLCRVGTVTAEPGCRLVRKGHNVEPLPEAGWTHELS